jgi:hypothetical protein
LEFIDRSREIEKKRAKRRLKGAKKAQKGSEILFFLKKFDEIRDESMKMKEVVIFFIRV